MDNIGRNDKCFCGSGKKYKNCCLKKLNSDLNFDIWKQNGLTILDNSMNLNEHKNKILDTLFSVLRYIENKSWTGACHAVSSILYILFNEQGLEAELCLGEVKFGEYYFDHSWIELNDKIFDVAIYKTLTNMWVSAPIVNSINVDTKVEPYIKYGVKSGLEYSKDTLMAYRIPFELYMDNYPENINGLWGVVKDLGSEIGLNLEINELKIKYKNVKRVIK